MRRTKAGETHQEASNGSRTGNHSRGKLDFIPDKPAFTLIKHRPTSEAGGRRDIQVVVRKNVAEQGILGGDTEGLSRPSCTEAP